MKHAVTHLSGLLMLFAQACEGRFKGLEVLMADPDGAWRWRMGRMVLARDVALSAHLTHRLSYDTIMTDYEDHDD